MSKIFNQVQNPKIKRNAFDLSHERKFSMNMGKLYPILCEEVIPGDTFNLNSEVLMRMAPLVAPIMHRVNVFTHYFFVPNRLIWDDWQKFITGGDLGTDNPLFPQIHIGLSNYENFQAGSLADYLGVNMADAYTSHEDTLAVNALPFRAYNLIFNEFYRDQNLIELLPVDKTSGLQEDDGTHTTIRNRCWEKDYFTSALPWTQKGGEVGVPMQGSAPVELVGPYIGTQQVRKNDGSLMGSSAVSSNGGGSLVAGANYAYLDPNGSLRTIMDGSDGSIGINELRKAVRLQTWLERNARSGSRYIEQIRSHFGVTSSDARLQRPEFLGGGKTPVMISEVLQNSATDGTSPQGNMAGHGISAGSNHGFSRTFEEHGYIIGLISVLPRTAYQQGTRRHFSKDDRFDYFWPEFAQLGEQPVFMSEIYMSDNPDTWGKGVEFGYQSRYAEYKFIPSSVHGDFKKLDNGLDKWHMGRVFDTAPALNEDFVNSQDVTQRIYAVTDANIDKLYCQVYHNFKAIRPMPYFGTPTL